MIDFLITLTTIGFIMCCATELIEFIYKKVIQDPTNEQVFGITKTGKK